MQRLAERKQTRIAEGGPDQGDTEWQPVILEAGGDGDCSQVEEVHEIGVDAEIAVEHERIGEHLGNGVLAGRRRRYEDISRRPGGFRHAAELSQSILRGKGVRGAERAACGDDPARNRVERLRLTLNQVADGDIALRDPRALVEEPCGSEERRQIDLDQFAAESGDPLDHGMEQLLPCPVAEEFQVHRARNAESRSLHLVWQGDGHIAAREGIGRVEGFDYREDVAGIIRGEREERETVDRAARRHSAARAYQATTGLEADDVVELCRHAPRAGGVGAKGDAHQPRRDRNRRARARPAGDIGRVQRAAGSAIGRTCPVQPGRELVEIGLADRNRAGVDEALHDRRVPIRPIGEGRAAGGGRMAGKVDAVLDRERNPVEGPSDRPLRLQTHGPRQQLVPREHADPDLVVAAGGDALHDALDDSRRRQRAAGIAVGKRRKVERIVRPQRAALALQHSGLALTTSEPCVFRAMRQIVCISVYII